MINAPLSDAVLLEGAARRLSNRTSTAWIAPDPIAAALHRPVPQFAAAILLMYLVYSLLNEPSVYVIWTGQGGIRAPVHRTRPSGRLDEGIVGSLLAELNRFVVVIGEDPALFPPSATCQTFSGPTAGQLQSSSEQCWKGVSLWRFAIQITQELAGVCIRAIAIVSIAVAAAAGQSSSARWILAAALAVLLATRIGVGSVLFMAKDFAAAVRIIALSTGDAVLIATLAFASRLLPLALGIAGFVSVGTLAAYRLKGSCCYCGLECCYRTGESTDFRHGWLLGIDFELGLLWFIVAGLAMDARRKAELGAQQRLSASYAAWIAVAAGGDYTSLISTAVAALCRSVPSEALQESGTRAALSLDQVKVSAESIYAYLRSNESN